MIQKSTLAWCLAMSLALVGCSETSALSDQDAGVAQSPDGSALPPGDIVWLPSVAQVDSPPALSGGSLEVTPDGLIIAGDTDRATLWILDPANKTLRGTIQLEAGDEPGRIAIDGSGRAHVVLRRAGELLSIDPEAPRVLERRPVCAAPRGLTWDSAQDLLWVACAGGELIALPSSGGPPAQTWHLDDDLRDVLISNGRLLVSRFRSAELLEIDPTSGEVLSRRRPREREFVLGMTPAAQTQPNTAWRIRLGPAGEVVMLHQTSVSSELEVAMAGHSGGGCPGVGVVAPAVTVFLADGTIGGGGLIPQTPLAVDLAIDPVTPWYFVARAATDVVRVGLPSGVLSLSPNLVADDCMLPALRETEEQPPSVAVAHLPNGRLVSMHRDPLQIVVERTVTFAGASLTPNRGFDLFHTATPSLTTCASCHAEGGEDGMVWNFADIGPRRTQSLLGGVLSTAPFHWSGDQVDMQAIMTGGFMQRMGARNILTDDARLIGTWLDSQPLPARSGAAAEVLERGRAHFESSTTACSSCHSGEWFTNNESMNGRHGGGLPGAVAARRRVPGPLFSRWLRQHPRRAGGRSLRHLITHEHRAPELAGTSSLGDLPSLTLTLASPGDPNPELS